MLQACDVQLTFGKPDAIYAVGDEVSGTVYLTPRRSLYPNGLKLELFWRTHGRGNRASGKTLRHDLDLPERHLEAGRTYTVPFRFTAPAGPLTYRGHLLNVDWYVRAVLDVPVTPGLLDPKAKTELLLLPQAGVSVSLGPKYRPPKANATLGQVAWPLVLFGAVFGGIGLAIFFTLLGSFAALLPLLFVLAGALFIFIGFRNALASWRLGDVALSLNPRELVPGDTLSGEVRFTPRAGVRLERLRLTLKAQERVVQGSGTNQTTHRHTVYEEVRERLSQRTLTAGEPVAVSERFQVPLDAPYTFVADDNALHWSLEVLIDVKGLLNWQRDAPLTVRSWREDEGEIIG